MSESSGSYTLEVRQFEHDDIDNTFENQRSFLWAHQSSISPDGDVGGKFSFKARYDDQDEARNQIWPEDVYIQKRFDEHKVILGYQIFNLSYMEAFHPLDIGNARIYDSSIITADKIGELGLGIEASLWDGEFKLYSLPKPAKPIYPGKKSRFQVDFDRSKVQWIGEEHGDQLWTDHFLLSYEKSFDNFDSQLVVHKGIDRNKLFVGTTDYQTIAGNTVPKTGAEFLIYFPEQVLLGAGIVYNFEDFQLKSTIATHAYEQGHKVLTSEDGLVTPDDYSEVVIGFEKPISHNNGFDSTFYFEYQKIFVDKDDDAGSLQNDIFLGWKLNLNDIASTEIDTSLVYDVSGSEEGFVQSSYTTRLLEDFKLKAGVVLYLNTDKLKDSLDPLKDADHVFADLSFFY